MTWLIFLYAFTLGAEQTNMVMPDLQWYGYTEFEASVMIFKTLEIGGASTIYIKPINPPWFTPIEGDFRVFGRLRFGVLTVEGEHLCIHAFKEAWARDIEGYNRLTLTFSNKGKP